LLWSRSDSAHSASKTLRYQGVTWSQRRVPKASFPQQPPPENEEPSMIVYRTLSFFDAARNGSTRISRCRSGTPGWNWCIGNMPAIGHHTAAVRRVSGSEPRIFPTNYDLVPSASWRDIISKTLTDTYRYDLPQAIETWIHFALQNIPALFWGCLCSSEVLAEVDAWLDRNYGVGTVIHLG
jgi:hypothetical protein